MLKFFRKYSRFFAFYMILVVVNLSVDAPDAIHVVNDRCVSTEDLSINEMESISEWILEHFFGITNAVPEYDDDDISSIHKVFIHQSLCRPEPIVYLQQNYRIVEKSLYSYKPSFWYCVTKPVLEHPPRS